MNESHIMCYLFFHPFWHGSPLIHSEKNGQIIEIMLGVSFHFMSSKKYKPSMCGLKNTKYKGWNETFSPLMIPPLLFVQKLFLFVSRLLVKLKCCSKGLLKAPLDMTSNFKGSKCRFSLVEIVKMERCLPHNFT